jgi:hypothetical protein
LGSVLPSFVQHPECHREEPRRPVYDLTMGRGPRQTDAGVAERALLNLRSWPYEILSETMKIFQNL